MRNRDDREPLDIPSAAPAPHGAEADDSPEVDVQLIDDDDEVSGLLESIHDELGEEEPEEPLADSLIPEARDSQPSIPDFLANALIGPWSPVDAWASDEEERPVREERNPRWSIVDAWAHDFEPPEGGKGVTAAEPNSPQGAARKASADRSASHTSQMSRTSQMSHTSQTQISTLAPVAASERPAASDDGLEDAPETLRPSAFDLEARTARKTQTAWLLAGFAAAAIGAVVAWQAPLGSQLRDRLLRPLDEAQATPAAAPPQAHQRPAATPVNLPEASPQSGTLKVTSSTEGARISIDGKAPEPPPLSLDDLSTGNHLVRIEAPGYHSIERTIELQPGGHVDLGDFQLEAEPHHLVLEIEPPAAFVMFTQAGAPHGKRYAGPWPRVIEVEPGKHQVVVFRAGYTTMQREVTVEPGTKTTAHRIRLPPANGGDNLELD